MVLLSKLNDPRPAPFSGAIVRPTYTYSVFAAWRPFILMLGSILMMLLSPYPYLSAAFAIFWMLVSVYKIWYVASSKYEINGEQIIYTRGIFNISTDFIELYRIKDYRVRRPMLMRLISVMKLELVTSDKMNPEFVIQGIPSSELATQIRDLVELNRGKKNVFEVD